MQQKFELTIDELGNVLQCNGELASMKILEDFFDKLEIFTLSQLSIKHVEKNHTGNQLNQYFENQLTVKLGNLL